MLYTIFQIEHHYIYFYISYFIVYVFRGTVAQWLNALAFSLSVPSMVGSSPTDCEIIFKLEIIPKKWFGIHYKL